MHNKFLRTLVQVLLLLAIFIGTWVLLLIAEAVFLSSLPDTEGHLQAYLMTRYLVPLNFLASSVWLGYVSRGFFKSRAVSFIFNFNFYLFTYSAVVDFYALFHAGPGYPVFYVVCMFGGTSLGMFLADKRQQRSQGNA